MNGPFQVAEASGTGNANNAIPPRIFKLTKPLTDQSVVINLGYDQKVQVDFSAIADDKITLVHVGEKLIILFDNQSTVTVEPFFDSRHDALQNLTIEVAPGRDLTVSEFANTFPITTDASVLPATGTDGNAQASGAHFVPPSLDPLPPIPTNILAPPEELPNLEFTNPTFAGLPLESPPPPPPSSPPPPLSPLSIIAGIGQPLAVDESFIPGIGSQVAVAGSPTSNIDTEAFAASFTVNAPAGVQSLTYALTLSLNGVDSGLIDSATGNHVFLFLQGGQVQGREGATAGQAGGGQIDFTLSVDPTGHVTMTELRGVHQGVGESPDISEGISLPAGLVSLTATVTDNNNATASASIDLGPQITIHDDGPITTAVVSGGTVDEDALVVPPAGVVDPPSGFGGTATGNVSGLFFAGADAPLHYSFTAAGAPVLTSGGVTLVYTVSGVGTGTETLTAKAGATTVFTLTLDETTGDYNFTLAAHLDHPVGAGENNLAIALGAVIQATDSDGDSVVATGSLAITVIDDVPQPITTAVVSGGTVDEDALVVPPAGVVDPPSGFGGTATGNVSGLFFAGADAPLHYSFTAAGAPVLTSGGVTLVYTVSGVGTGTETLTAKAGATTVFTLTLDETSGATLFTLSSHLDHATANGENNLAINFGPAITATDTDGDPTTASGSFTVTVIDDVPQPITTAVVSGGTVDEDALVVPPAGVVDPPSGFGGTATGNVSGLFFAGADAPLHYSFTAAGAPVLTSGGVTLVYTVSGVGTGTETLTAKAGATTVFTLTLDETSGATLFTLSSHLDHATANGENNLAINFGPAITATDTDGDPTTASGSFTVTVIDDVPQPITTAVVSGGTVDEDALVVPPAGVVDPPSGFGGTATGNVSGLFFAGADAPLHYSFTAAGAPVLTSGGVTLVYTVSGVGTGTETLTAKAGATTVFTLTLDETSGATLFTLSSHLDHATANGENNLAINFGPAITATDTDGDPTTASGSFTVTVIDDVPQPITTAVVSGGTVDEDALVVPPAGVVDPPSGFGGTATGNVSGLFFAGADAPLHYSFTAAGAPVLTSGGVTLVYTVSGVGTGTETLTAKAGATTVFTLTLDETSGATLFTLSSHLDHATANGENNLAINFGPAITATDTDGDPTTASGSFTVTVIDDVPQPITTAVVSGGTVDEDALVVPPAGVVDPPSGFGGTATGNVSGLFFAGADAPLHYSFTAAGAPVLTSGGVTLVYTVSGVGTGTETLTAKAGATTVFTLTLDETSGATLFTLSSHLDHATANGENNLAINFGPAITATDTDGDPTTASGSFTVTVIDDVPQPITTAVVSGGTVDEDALVVPPAGVVDPPSGFGGTATGNVSGLFFAGADAPLHYSFTAAGAPVLTSGGVTLVYTVSGVGTGTETLTAKAGATTVFTLTLDETSGATLFTLSSHLDHATANGENNLAINFGPAITATDTDGDPTTASGSFTVTVIDDVPQPITTAVVSGGTVDEDALVVPPAGVVDPPSGFGGTATGNVSGLFFAGADAPLHYSFTAAGAPVLTSGGVTLVYTVSGVGTGTETLTAKAGATTVFTLTLDETSGATLFTLSSHLDHATANGENNLAINFGPAITATDTDGDPTTASGSFTVTVIDDVPQPITTAVVSGGTVDEDALVVPPAGVVDPPSGFGGTATGNVSGLFFAGADAPLHYSFTAAGAPVLTSGGVTLVYTVSGVGTGTETLTAKAGATTVFTLTLDETSGATLFTLSSHLDHATANGENNLAINFGPAITATDTDGDPTTASGSFTVTVIDDVPQPITTAVVSGGTVDEDALVVPPAGVVDPPSGFGGTATGNVSGLFFAGADAPLHYSFTAAGAPVLTSGGVTLVYTVSGVGTGTETLTAKAGATTVFTLTLDETSGATLFTLSSHLDHATANGENNLAINFGPAITATDTDGDPTTASGSFTVTVIDDVPQPITTAVVSGGTVDEDALVVPPAGVVDPPSGFGGTATGNVSGLFFAGADAPLHYSFTAAGAPVLTSGGVTLVYTVSGVGTGTETLTAKAGATTVFTLTLDETSGATLFTLSSHLDHATANGENNLAINFGPAITATDTDGDPTTASGSFTVTVIDDVPQPITTAVVSGGTVDEDALVVPPAGVVDPPSGFGGTATGNVSGLFFAGADAPLHYSFTAAGAPVLTSGGVTLVYTVSGVGTGTETLTAKAGATTVFTLTLDETSGATLFTLSSHLDHATANGENNLAINFGPAITATDTDGDPTTASGSFTVTVIDDVPQIGAIQNASMPSISDTEAHGTWQPFFGADGLANTAAIGITIPNGGNFTVTDTQVANGSDEIFQVVVGGANPYTFYEYTHYDSVTHSAEMSAYSTLLDAQAGSGTNEFFTLTMAADGTYDFHLISNELQTTQSASLTATRPGNGTWASLDGTTFTLGSGLHPAQGSHDVIIDGNDGSILESTYGGRVFVDNLGIGIDNSNFNTGETIFFEFANIQSGINFGVAKATSSVEHFTITLYTGNHLAFATEDVILTDGATVFVDPAHWGIGVTGTGTGYFSNDLFGQFDEVGVTNNATLSGQDSSVVLSNLVFNEQTIIGSTTLNFTPAITDGDGDTATGSTLAVALNGTPNASGGYDLTGTTAPEVLVASAGPDHLNGGTGPGDTIDYSNSNAGVNVNLATNAVSGGWAAGDTISNIENVIGSAFADTLTANSTGSILNGGAGNDTLNGGIGNDTLIGGPGVDSLTGGGGSNIFQYSNPLDGGGQGSLATITSANTDTITDFNPANDVIAASALGFGGGLTAGEVFNSTQVQNAPDNLFTNSAERFLFDTANQTLYYSPDGTTANEHAVAILNLVQAINPTNVHVVA